MQAENFPNIDPTEIDLDEVRAFSKESQFMRLAVSLMIEATKYACIAACTTGDQQVWDRDHAAIGGNMVRLYQLIDSFIDQTTQDRSETVQILSRLIFETSVNILYLIENFSKETIDSYIESSLRFESRLLKRINGEIERRSGIRLPIEDRMIQSIERIASISQISLTSLNTKEKGIWDKIDMYSKAKSVWLEGLYLAAFAGMSINIHGAWGDLYGHHLEYEDGGGFRPKISWARPRPQVILTLPLVVTNSIQKYFYFIAGEEVGDYFETRLNDLVFRIHKLAAAHDEYLSGKTWPFI